MKFSQLKVAVVNIIIIILMIIVSLISYISFLLVQRDSDFIVQETIPVIIASENLMKDILSENSSTRGYIITHNKKLLENYYSGLNNLKIDLEIVEKYSKLNSRKLNDLIINKAIPKIDIIQSLLNAQIKSVENGDIEEIIDRVLKNKQEMDDFRKINNEMLNEMKEVTNSAWSKAKSAGDRSKFVIGFGILMSIIAGFVSILMYKRSVKAEKILHENAENLEQQNEEILSQQAEQEEILHKMRELIAENEQQYWIKNQFARITALSQGIVNLEKLSSMLISEIARVVEAGQGVFYVKNSDGKSMHYGEYMPLGSYAYTERENLSGSFRKGQGLVGQCALEKEVILLTNIPSDYVII